MTNFEYRWQEMQRQGEANFVVRWGMLRFGLSFTAISLLASIFDYLKIGVFFAVVNFSIHALYGVVGGVVLAGFVWKWYEHSARDTGVS